jgi:hypothetical protein
MAAAGAARIRSMVLEEVKQHFRPELLNRFDEQVGAGRGASGAWELHSVM